MTGATFRVRWTDITEDDLTAIIDYIAIENVESALTVFHRLRDVANELYEFPERGRIVPELQIHGIFHYRELLPTPWRVIYRIEEKTVFVAAVIDGRRDLEHILLERLSRA